MTLSSWSTSACREDMPGMSWRRTAPASICRVQQTSVTKNSPILLKIYIIKCELYVYNAFGVFLDESVLNALQLFIHCA